MEHESRSSAADEGLSDDEVFGILHDPARADQVMAGLLALAREMELDLDEFDELLERGLTPEQARFVVGNFLAF